MSTLSEPVSSSAALFVHGLARDGAATTAAGAPGLAARAGGCGGWSSRSRRAAQRTVAPRECQPSAAARPRFLPLALTVSRFVVVTGLPPVGV